MIALFDRSAALQALPLGTGNKTERLLGYFTWHADDSPPVNPLGDLFKTQVWALARHLGVPGGDRRQAGHGGPGAGPDRRGRFRHQPTRGPTRSCTGCSRAIAPRRSPALGFSAGRGGAGARPAGFDPLEAEAADGGDAEPDGDRRVLPAAGGLLMAARIPPDVVLPRRDHTS